MGLGRTCARRQQLRRSHCRCSRGLEVLSPKMSYADFGGCVRAESLLGIGVGLALAAAAGFRVFVPLLVLSLAARGGWVALSPSFDWLGTTSALVALATATVLEVAAYYVPFFDNMLDSLTAPVAILAGI